MTKTERGIMRDIERDGSVVLYPPALEYLKKMRTKGLVTFTRIAGGKLKVKAA